MEGKREGNFRFLEGNSAEKKDKNEKFYFAEVEALFAKPYNQNYIAKKFSKKLKTEKNLL